MSIYMPTIKSQRSNLICPAFGLTVVPVLLNLTVEGMRFDTCMALEKDVSRGI